MTSPPDIPALEVEGETVSLRDVLRLAKFAGDLKFLQDAIDAELIRQAAARHGVEVSDKELQQAADEFRIARELHDAEATDDWLAARQLTYGDWEQMLERQVAARKLRERLTAGRVEQHFAEHMLAFEVAHVSRIVAADEDLARELRAQIVEDGADFHALARQFSTDAATRLAGGYVGPLGRADFEAASESAVFGASAGQVVGPFKTDHGWTLFKVESVERAVLDDARREAIASQLFDEWLSERRRKAKVSAPI
ncbi:MAG TPA: peptidylprolyl isomerase, partial [Pyrinomonadaceae bacterium]|nr:peptidylprolyl isomerase [Pyrinomonadaceae bacterium]